MALQSFLKKLLEAKVVAQFPLDLLVQSRLQFQSALAFLMAEALVDLRHVGDLVVPVDPDEVENDVSKWSPEYVSSLQTTALSRPGPPSDAPDDLGRFSVRRRDASWASPLTSFVLIMMRLCLAWPGGFD